MPPLWDGIFGKRREKRDNVNQKTNRERAVQAFLAAIICYSVATGLSSSIYTNYFKEAYQADSFLRGLIEIPRESPGILTLLLISGLGFLGNVELAVIAHALITVGLVVMGFLSPSLGVMMVFLFINSLGTHMLLTLNDAIAISLAEKGKTGTMLGKVKGISTFCSLLIAVVVFFGFRLGWFSFTTPVILPFAIAAVVSLGAVTAMLRMKRLHPDGGTAKKFHLLLRKEYIPYYCITFAYGCQKRIRLVFGPWVIAELLYMGADTLALLAIATHFIGTAFGPWIGRMLDKWGVRKMLLIEAGYIAVTAGMLGIAAQLLYSGSSGGWLTIFTFVAYVLCNLLEPFNMVHSYLMRYLALDPSEVTESLSAGLAVDHIVAIVISPVFGFVWLNWGPGYVFFIVALFSLCQMAVSLWLRGKKAATEM